MCCIWSMWHTLRHHRDQRGRGQIRQSILGYQRRGGRIVCLKQTGVGLYCCMCSREWRGKQWSGLQSMGGKGGTWSESHVGMGVVVWPKNRMIFRRVSSLVDRERFLLQGHKDWRNLGVDAEHVRIRKGPSLYLVHYFVAGFRQTPSTSTFSTCHVLFVCIK